MKGLSAAVCHAVRRRQLVEASITDLRGKICMVDGLLNGMPQQLQDNVVHVEQKVGGAHRSQTMAQTVTPRAVALLSSTDSSMHAPSLC